MKCKYKCDDFTTYSLNEMTDYVLSQCSPEDTITTWVNLLEGSPTLYDGNSDYIIGRFCLGDLLVMYRNNILAREMYLLASDCVYDWLTDELKQYTESRMPMLDISININSFHIDLIWED